MTILKVDTNKVLKIDLTQIIGPCAHKTKGNV